MDTMELWFRMVRKLGAVMEHGEINLQSLGTMTHLPEVDACWQDLQREFDISQLNFTIVFPDNG